MIKSISLAAVAVLVLVGCNSGSGDSGAKAATLADAEKLAQNIGTGASVGSSVSDIGKSSTTTLSTKSRVVAQEACLDGGNMVTSFDESQFVPGQIPTSVDMSIQMNNCQEEGETVNGKMVFQMKNFTEDNMDMTISFPTDFTAIADGKTMKINAGGSIRMQEQTPYEVMTINMTMTNSTETYGGKNLVYKMRENASSAEIFPVSGEENFGTGVYFRVDPNYDASQTPMVTNYNGDLESGMFKYLDGVNHKVEVEVTAVNEVTVRVDVDGNGSFEANEIEVVSVD